MELHKKFYNETGKLHRVFVSEGSSVGVSFWYYSTDYVRWLEKRLNKVVATSSKPCPCTATKTGQCGEWCFYYPPNA